MENKNKGAITVFLILITTVVFCFVGLMIDGARILVAKSAVNEAAATAMRSTLGHYDKTLVSEYGLYAIQDTNKEKIADIYNRYLKANLISKSTNKSLEEHRAISLVSFDEKDIKSTVTPSDPLIRSDVFEEQVFDYMKFRAPATTLMDILDFFAEKFGKNADKAMSEIDKASDAEKKGKTAKKNVKSANDKINDANKKIAKKLTPTHTKSVNWYQELDVSEGENGDSSFNSVYNSVSSSIVKQLESVEKTVAKDASKSVASVIWSGTSEGFNKKIELDDELKDFKIDLTDARTAAEDYKNSSGSSGDMTAEQRAEASTYVDMNYTDPPEIVGNVDRAQENINSTVQKIEKKVNEYNNAVSEQRTLDALSKLALYRQAHDESEYSNEEYLADYKYIIGKCESSSYKNSAPSSSRLKVITVKELDDLRKSAASKVNGLIDEISSIKIDTIPEVSLPKESDKSEEMEKEEEGKADAKLAELKASLETIQGKERSMSQKRGLFSSISPYKIDNSSYEPVVDRDSIDGSMLKKVLSFFKDIYSDALLSSYIMEKCTYVTSASGREHYFQYGEVEYILYGTDNQFLNITLNAGVIWMTRFLIDSVTYFVDSAIPTPLIRLCYALARGGIQSCIDMVQIYGTNEGCMIIPNIQDDGTGLLRLTYDEMCFVSLVFTNIFVDYDYFANRLKDTMQATIQYQDSLKGSAATGADLTKMYTKLTAEVRVGVDLVFLPLLGFGIVETDNFSNGNHFIPCTVVAGY